MCGQAEEQSRNQAAQASQAIRAAEYLQGELNSAKSALQQRQSQGYAADTSWRMQSFSLHSAYMPSSTMRLGLLWSQRIHIH